MAQEVSALSALLRRRPILGLVGAGVLLAAVAAMGLWGRDARRRARNRRIVIEAARRLEMSPELLLAVAQVESGFDDRARSEKGALGLMQVVPATGRETAVRLGLDAPDLLDPRDNALVGGAYLKELLGRYRRDLHLALAAYHAGPGRVDEWVRRGRGLPGPEVVNLFGFRATRRYVNAVLQAERQTSAAGAAGR